MEWADLLPDAVPRFHAFPLDTTLNTRYNTAMNRNNDNIDNNNDDNDPLFSDLPPEVEQILNGMTEADLNAMRQITDDPFGHPDSPFRINLDRISGRDAKDVAHGIITAQNWMLMNFTCFEQVMKETEKDLPPYLARRVNTAMRKMCHIVRESAEVTLAIGQKVGVAYDA